MENLDIIILTSILCTLFVVFGIFLFREFKNISETPNYTPESGPRANMIKFIGGLFDEDSKPKTKKEKQQIYKAVTRTISDMESDGIYFPEEVRQKLKEYKDEMNCEYSGLPSVKSYEK